MAPTEKDVCAEHGSNQKEAALGLTLDLPTSRSRDARLQSLTPEGGQSNHSLNECLFYRGTRALFSQDVSPVNLEAQTLALERVLQIPFHKCCTPSRLYTFAQGFCLFPLQGPLSNPSVIEAIYFYFSPTIRFPQN